MNPRGNRLAKRTLSRYIRAPAHPHPLHALLHRSPRIPHRARRRGGRHLHAGHRRARYRRERRCLRTRRSRPPDQRDDLPHRQLGRHAIRGRRLHGRDGQADLGHLHGGRWRRHLPDQQFQDDHHDQLRRRRRRGYARRQRCDHHRRRHGEARRPLGRRSSDRGLLRRPGGHDWRKCRGRYRCRRVCRPQRHHHHGQRRRHADRRRRGGSIVRQWRHHFDHQRDCFHRRGGRRSPRAEWRRELDHRQGGGRAGDRFRRRHGE